jgi:fluoroquinolone transport system permease protein
MKAIINSTNILLKQVGRDSMTALFFILPVVFAFVIRFGIQVLQTLLQNNCGVNLTEYYPLFDLILVMISPYFFGFGASMIILGEMDEHILPSYYVSPLSKKGYLVSRLLIPIILSLTMTIVLISFFHLSMHGFILNLVLSLLGTLLCLIPFLLIISYAKNKVEGMVLAKFSSLILMGILIPYFITDRVQYLFSFLPSFWIAKLTISNNYHYVIPSVICSMFWIWLLYRKFNRKIMY